MTFRNQKPARWTILLALTAIAAWMPAGEVAPTTAPSAETASATTMPSTQPAGMTVSGTVEVSKEWSLKQPDLSRVVIFLDSDPALDAVPRPQEPVSVAQINKAFVPNFTVVPCGTSVEFPNWDEYFHNVFSRSKAAPAFDLDRYPKGQSKTRTFDKVGVVQIFCNIHPQMRAIVYVTPNVYSTRASADGKFSIENVPPGHYTLVAWQDRCGEQRQPIDVTADQATEVHFTLREDREQIMANDAPKKSSSYGITSGLGVKRERLNLPVVGDAHAAPTPAPNDQN